MIKKQAEELKAVVATLNTVILEETSQVAKIITGLEEKLKDFEGVDISNELAELKAASDRIKAIATVPDEEPSEEPLEV